MKETLDSEENVCERNLFAARGHILSKIPVNTGEALISAFPGRARGVLISFKSWVAL